MMVLGYVFHMCQALNLEMLNFYVINMYTIYICNQSLLNLYTVILRWHGNKKMVIPLEIIISFHTYVSLAGFQLLSVG